MGRKEKKSTSLLRRLRQEQRLTLDEMAERTNYSKSYLSGVETGKLSVTRRVLEAYERGLGLDPGKLTHRQDLEEDTSSGMDVANLLKKFSAGLGSRLATEDIDLANVPELSKQQEVLRGREVMRKAISLLVAAANDSQLPHPGDPILIASSTPVPEEFSAQWWAALHSVLREGWDVTHLWHISDDVTDSLTLVDRLLPLLGLLGTYRPYYFLPEHVSIAATHDVLVVPGKGGLIFFGTRQANRAHTAFFFSEEEHIKVLCEYFSTLQTRTQPLLKVYPYLSIDLDFVLLRAEEEPGDRLLVRDGVNAMLIPNSVDSARVRRVFQTWTDLKAQDQSEMKLQLQAMLDNNTHRKLLFDKHVKGWGVQHVASKGAIQDFVSTGRHDDWITEIVTSSDTRDQKVAWLLPEERVACIEYVIDQLRTHPNFELALVDPPIGKQIFRLCWEVVGAEVVLLQMSPGEKVRPETLYLVIYEPTVVGAFHKHFMNLWESLAPESKEKEKVIKWLSERIVQGQAQKIERGQRPDLVKEFYQNIKDQITLMTVRQADAKTKLFVTAYRDYLVEQQKVEARISEIHRGSEDQTDISEPETYTYKINDLSFDIMVDLRSISFLLRQGVSEGYEFLCSSNTGTIFHREQIGPTKTEATILLNDLVDFDEFQIRLKIPERSYVQSKS